jgi:hypothetical protein
MVPVPVEPRAPAVQVRRVPLSLSPVLVSPRQVKALRRPAAVVAPARRPAVARRRRPARERQLVQGRQGRPRAAVVQGPPPEPQTARRQNPASRSRASRSSPVVGAAVPAWLDAAAPASWAAARGRGPVPACPRTRRSMESECSAAAPSARRIAAQRPLRSCSTRSSPRCRDPASGAQSPPGSTCSAVPRPCKS